MKEEIMKNNNEIRSFSILGGVNTEKNKREKAVQINCFFKI